MQGRRFVAIFFQSGYRSKIIDRQSGNRSGDPDEFIRSLIKDGN
jgi:hypothetical protein